MKYWISFCALLAIVCYAQADIKIIREVNIIGDNAIRKETFSLKNPNTAEEELVIEGTLNQRTFPKDRGDEIYRIETIYVADKDGYRVKYKITLEPFKPVVLQVSPSTLKSAVG